MLYSKEVRMQIKHIGLSIVFLLFSVFIYAQNGDIRGQLYDAKTGEPIIYGTITIADTDYGTTTDLDGFFTLTGIPVGEYKIVASYIGFETVEQTVSVTRTKIAFVKILMEEGGVKLGVVDISARREQARTEVKVSQLNVSKKDIKLLPSTGGDADIVQYLQVLPGIISTGDQGGQLYIRGGSPIQNKILLDGLTIYNPFHSIGFYSVFETELIQNADVLTGGFGAEHGGRISAIVDIKTRAGNKRRLSGQVTASPFMVKGLLEGPIIKLSDDRGSASFVLTHKRAIIDETSLSLYPRAAVNDTVGLPFAFSDTYGKLSFESKGGSRFNVFGFNFTDGYNNPSIANIEWENLGGGLDFRLLPSTSNLMLKGLMGFSSYETEIIVADDNPRFSKIREYVLGLDFTFFGDNREINYGVEAKGVRTEFEFVNPFNLKIDQIQNTTNMNGFVKYRQIIGGLILEPSLRLQYYASNGELSLEPRFGLKYNITDNIRFKFAGGLYSQNLISTSNERDVVNLFNGFLSSPEENIADNFNGGFTDSKLQRARHAIAGIEYDFSNGIQFNVEGYFKDFPSLVIVNRNRLSVDEPNYTSEIGEAYGVDFSMKYENAKWYLWSTYSLGYVNRNDGFQEYPTVFDRRHNVNFLASYNLDEDGDFKLSARWNMGSGFPFTKTQGFYNFLPFLNGFETDPLTENPDDIGIIFSETRNGGRLPYYHRLDLSATYIHDITDFANVELVASVTNAYDRKNIFYFDRLRYERVNQLPIIPSLAVKFNF